MLAKNCQQLGWRFVSKAFCLFRLLEACKYSEKWSSKKDKKKKVNNCLDDGEMGLAEKVQWNIRIHPILLVWYSCAWRTLPTNTHSVYSQHKNVDGSKLIKALCICCEYQLSSIAVFKLCLVLFVSFLADFLSASSRKCLIRDETNFTEDLAPMTTIHSPLRFFFRSFSKSTPTSWLQTSGNLLDFGRFSFSPI